MILIHQKKSQFSIFLALFFLFFLPTDNIAQCISGNCSNGKGTYLFKDGSKYIGTFRNFIPHGVGICYFKNGNVYNGNWSLGKKSGQGTYTYKSGNTYEGSFISDKIAGQGKMAYQNGDMYIGSWVDQKYAGKGVYHFADGDRYEGGFLDGYFQGSGKMIRKDGSSYEGNWTKNKKDGEGLTTYADGRKIFQKYKMNVLLFEEEQTSYSWASSTKPKTNHIPATNAIKDCNQNFCHLEKGIYVYGDGSKYEGAFVNGIPQGKGKCNYVNGDVYIGEWKNHAPNGKGIMHFVSGNKVAALWKEGVLQEKLKTETELAHKPQILYEGEPSNNSFGEVNIYALVVGVATYNHAQSLKYTDDDAYQLYAFLKSPEGGALMDDKISILIDDAATRPNIIKELNKIIYKADGNDVIMLYLSGHGLDGCYVPFDFDGSKNLLSYSEILTLLDEAPAKHKLFITDACHSGSMIAQARAPFQISLAELYQAYDNTKGGTAIMMSSKKEEVSLEYGGLRQGVFSHFLIKGLKGSANTNGDDIISIEELFHYVNTQVKQYTMSAQNPSIQGNYDPKMPVAMIRKR